MNRTLWLVSTVIVLVLAYGTYQWSKTWGLITIHCEDWTPSKVVREIERQSGIVLKTNVPEDVKIRLDLDRVTLGEALESLSTLVEGRWRLAYFFAPTLPEAHAAASSAASGQRVDGWKNAYVPLMMPTDNATTGDDPRTDHWNVKAADKPEFQAYVHQAAESVSAAFFYPETWNPAVSAPPAAGAIRTVAPALAKAAGGRVLEIFLLERRDREPGEDRGDRGGPPGGEFGERFRGRDDGDRMRASFAARAQAEIDKLPPDQRAVAQAEFDERKKFFESLKDLSPEERRAKFQEMMENPTAQERMDQRMNDRNNRMSPQQRLNRGQKYVQRRAAARGGAN